jgi:hypothetical protein
VLDDATRAARDSSAAAERIVVGFGRSDEYTADNQSVTTVPRKTGGEFAQADGRVESIVGVIKYDDWGRAVGIHRREIFKERSERVVVDLAGTGAT